MSEKEKLANYLYSVSANVAISNFLRDFDSLIKDNKSIENSHVIQMLDGVLVDPERCFYVTIPKGTILYRARQIRAPKHYKDKKYGIRAFWGDDKSFQTAGFNQYDSKEPPIGVPPQARNNIEGMSYLYLTDDEYTACAEIRPEQESCISLASFELQRDIVVIDFSCNKSVKALLPLQEQIHASPAIIMTSIMQQFAKLHTDDKVYRITQYISDRIRKTGVDGLKYMSSLTKGSNVTVFNSHDSIVRFVRSKLVYSRAQEYQLIDVEKGDLINWQAKPSVWTDDDTQQLREELIKGISENTNDR